MFTVHVRASDLRRAGLDKHITTIEVSTPFALKPTVLATGWHECAPMSWCEGGQCFQLIERDRRDVFRVSVLESERTRWKVTLRVMIEGPACDRAIVAALVDRVKHVLAVDRDYAAFFALCNEHPTLHVLPKIGAGRTLRSATMAENIIKTVCGTNVNWSQAVKMINRIAQLGPAIPDCAHLNAWPIPKEILRAGPAYLSYVCRLGYRVESILSFCKEVLDGAIHPDGLVALADDDGVPSDDILAQLHKIRGVGPTSAHYLLSFLGRHDRLAIDSSTIAHVARVHTRGKKPTNRQIERIYDAYGPWKNLVWWFEYWLTWDTARTMLLDAGIDPPM